jgi:osmotically-inducible protein OsmY
MADEQLQADVVAELAWDPKVGSEAIAVSADAGTVTLRGTVDSFRAKREAERPPAGCMGSSESTTSWTYGC